MIVFNKYICVLLLPGKPLYIILYYIILYYIIIFYINNLIVYIFIIFVLFL